MYRRMHSKRAFFLVCETRTFHFHCRPLQWWPLGKWLCTRTRVEVRKPVAILFRFCKSYFGVMPDVVVRSSNPLTVVVGLEGVKKSENPCLHRQKSLKTKIRSIPKEKFNIMNENVSILFCKFITNAIKQL